MDMLTLYCREDRVIYVVFSANFSCTFFLSRLPGHQDKLKLGIQLQLGLLYATLWTPI